ncbi:hypothetical protein RG963_06735 [Methanosarcina sp. Z-7115]|uniref:Uncharacterized protein n=1 Tax=Methanosarcina baikalica TaxID=3073890 RepID=A0ABU2D0F9_9EURY|nr:hypothetical protein [Methanosarcina sp. Z-7115]MDR7665478.1 hypothetical protein [Methanosarcina sp. Z-7115]
MSLSLHIYDLGAYNSFAYKTSAPANIPKIQTAFLKDNPWVRALYTNRASFNTRIVKLQSHAREMKESVEFKQRKEIEGCVDKREACIIRNAQKSSGLFRVRGC